MLCCVSIGGVGMQTLYDTDKNAGQCMHSKIGWKDIMSTGDNLAIADPGERRLVVV